jgi:hypothetical protein
MDPHADLVNDLQISEPIETPPLLPPYDEEDTFNEKFEKAYACLQRNIHLKYRILALTDAYFLGKLLNEILNRTVRLEYSKRLTPHYLRIAKNTYDIFEYNPKQIQRTETIDVQRIRYLPRLIVRNLREIVLTSLAGARN